MTRPLKDILRLIEQIAPPSLQEDWDNCGLATGNPETEVAAVALSLDATQSAVSFAEKKGAGLLLVHHPPVFKPVNNIREDRFPGNLLADAVRRGVAIYAAHTSYDAAPGGLNDSLAELLGFTDPAPLAPCPGDNYVKLATFVPESHAEKVATAIFESGAGVIGDYSHCAFRHPGTGSFLPSATAKPFSGKKGQTSFEPEIKLEVRVPKNTLGKTITAMLAAHPYEEAAYDVYPVIGGDKWGVGRACALQSPMTLDKLADHCKSRLKLPFVRIVEAGRKKIRRVAICSGGGSSLLENAISSGADAYITGDVTYHMARDAQDRGIALVDVGHFGSERIFVDTMKRSLSQRMISEGYRVRLVPYRGEKDPLHTR